MSPPVLQEGLIVGNHGRHFIVETLGGERRICHSRGKKSVGVVGDRVLWQASQDEGTIEKILERQNLFYRQDEIRTKSFAANLTQVLILIAARPEFSSSQLSRALIAAEAAGISPLIVLNKSDLTEPFQRAWAWLQPYRSMGYQVLPLCLKDEEGPNSSQLLLRKHLDGQQTLVLGPSGAGKSTLINSWIPGALAQTGEISQALNSGKHTTTSTTWYWIDETQSSALIDSPGFQEFGLHHIDPANLASYMPDLRAHMGHCRFYNCTHLHEPGCGVRSALQTDPEEPLLSGISVNRYEIYKALFEELNQPRY
ncbi:MAG: hypothetical protein RLZZ591_538 [Pseudomonadota bacterium]|jgi:ribosome biogenesis GTPase